MGQLRSAACLFFFCGINVASKNLLDVVHGKTILAFGDSLTHGMYVQQDGEWRKTHPYAIRLQELIIQAKGDNTTTIIESGISGEQAKSMAHRLPSDIQKYSPKLVIILGGTNDLGMHSPVEHTIKNILKLHETALKSSISESDPVYTLAMTIPELTWTKEDTGRLKINREIREFVNRCRNRVAFLEMEHRFTQKNASNMIYWSPDKVHFSPLGYDMIGQYLYEAIRDFSLDAKTVSYNCP